MDKFPAGILNSSGEISNRFLSEFTNTPPSQRGRTTHKNSFAADFKKKNHRSFSEVESKSGGKSDMHFKKMLSEVRGFISQGILRLEKIDPGSLTFPEYRRDAEFRWIHSVGVGRL